MTYQATARRQNERRSAAVRTAPRAGSAYTRRVAEDERARAVRAQQERREEAARRERYERMVREERRRAAVREEERRRLEYFKYCERQIKEEQKAKRRKERAEERAKAKAAEREALKREIKVERKKLSFPFIAVLAIAAIMIAAVLLSYAQVNESSRAVSVEKTKLEKLETLKDELSFALEEKNDVRLVERIATEKIGMVKEGAVTKRFISLSDGDSIELENRPEEAGGGSGPLGTVLSAITGVLDDIRDYVG